MGGRRQAVAAQCFGPGRCCLSGSPARPVARLASDPRVWGSLRAREEARGGSTAEWVGCKRRKAEAGEGERTQEKGGITGRDRAETR